MRESAHPRSRGENRETGRIRVRSLGSSPLTRGKLPPRSARGRRRGLIPAHAGKTCFRRSVWRRGPAHPRSRGENDQGAPDHVWPAGSSPLTRGKPGLFSYTGHQCGLIPAHAGKTRHFAGGGACHAAHPRSRGENPVRCVDGQAASGSSPLTRGKHMPSRVTPKQQRLIPAHAGKTARQGPGSLSPRAHPRSRGENTTTAAHPASTGGSSPLTRGKPALTAFAPATPRLIPAHAGKTPPAHGQQTDATAHPRSRGENGRPRGIRLVARGSSPLTRGKLAQLADLVAWEGLIPAHAGKTPNTRPSTHSTRAHPRSRGENAEYKALDALDEGSSPLTRGKRRIQGPRRTRRGLIPAHAGKTRAARVAGRRSWAHPRSRGENAANIDCVKAEDGSSPLTRGKRAGRAAGSTASGLIPAHAGKTRWTVRRGGCRRAHPRSRGENTRLRRTPLGRSGSSPLTRGKQSAGDARHDHGRLIPAHAGKTMVRV